MNGYSGKILRVDLSAPMNHQTSIIDTMDYASWGGGHGIASAIFYDIMVREKGIDLSTIEDGFDDRNVVVIMTSPLSGTGVPSATSRTEIVGIGVHSTPSWFTRSNFGGRFAVMLKSAGWDGIVIEGSSPVPVWFDIRNDVVEIRECIELGLWGMDTWQTQQTIHSFIDEKGVYPDWMEVKAQDDKYKIVTTQRPAVCAIGPAGENLARVGSIVHDSGNGAGQGGFGGIWGAKKLKAISVIGTGTIHIADPAALVQARMWTL